MRAPMWAAATQRNAAARRERASALRNKNKFSSASESKQPASLNPAQSVKQTQVVIPVKRYEKLELSLSFVCVSKYLSDPGIPTLRSQRRRIQNRVNWTLTAVWVRKS